MKLVIVIRRQYQDERRSYPAIVYDDGTVEPVSWSDFYRLRQGEK